MVLFSEKIYFKIQGTNKNKKIISNLQIQTFFEIVIYTNYRMIKNLNNYLNINTIYIIRSIFLKFVINLS